MVFWESFLSGEQQIAAGQVRAYVLSIEPTGQTEFSCASQILQQLFPAQCLPRTHDVLLIIVQRPKKIFKT